MKNFLTLIGANVPTAAVCTAKSPQNSGGGSSQHFASRSIGAQSFTLRSIGAQMKNTSLISGCCALDVTSLSYRASDEHPMSTRSASDGRRWNSRGWKYVACMLLALVLGVGQMWGVDVTIAQPANPSSSSNNISYGLFIVSHNNSATYSSGAIKAANNGDEVTITLTTTKSDMYIKSVEFESPSNGSITSDDGTKSGNVFTITGNKNSVAIKLKSNSGAKGSVKFKQAVINSGANDFEAITFNSYNSSSKAFTFTSSSTTSALTSITQSTAKSYTVSSNVFSGWANQGDVVFTSTRKIQYIALLLTDAKNYSTFKENNNSGDALTNHVWTGNSNAVTIYNGTGGGRSIKNVYVVFAPSTFTLAWNLDGGSVDVAGTATGSYAAGTTITAPTVSKTGHTFSGWSPAFTGTMPAVNTTYTATWTAKEYSVTLHTNEGTINSGDIDSYTFGVGATLPTDVSKASCDFAGWYASSTFEGERVYTIGTDVTGDKEYWAKWVPAATKHNITYAGYGSADISSYPTQYSEGIGIASFAPLADTEDQHFLGWDPASIAASATTDQTITATWEDKKVVTFNSNGGSAVAAVKVVSGETVASPTAPTRLNWTFQKWQKGGEDYDFAAAVTEDITLDAVWSRNEISGTPTDITLAGATPTANKSPLTDVSYYNISYSSGNFSAGGGMGGDISTKTDGRYVGFTIPEGNTATVYVKGTGSSGRKIAVVTEANRAASTWTGNFLELNMTGTSNDIDGTSTTLSPGVYRIGSELSGLTIKQVIVHVTSSPLSVKLKVNGEVTQTINVTSGETLGNLFMNGELPVLDLDGFTFNGWKNEEGDAAVSKTTEITKSMVIYADLSAATYNVTLSKGTNATTAGAATIKMGAGALTITSATAGSGALKGFYTTSSGDVKVAEANGTLVEGDVTGFVTDGKWSKAANAELFAQYAPSYDVKFFPGYGENTQIGETQSILGGSYAVAPADPEREGFKFLGWSISSSKDDIKTVGSYGISVATDFTAIWQEKFKVAYYDGTTKLGEEIVLDGESPAHSGDYQTRMLADFDGWYNNVDLAEGHKITNVAALEIDANANIYGKWTKAYAQDIDFVAKIGTDGKTFDYAAFLSENGYLLTQGTGHQNELDNKNPFDTGLKLKNSTGNKLQFRAPAGKLVKVVMGKVNGMTYSVNGATAKSLNGGTDKDHLGVTYMYNAGEQEITLTETATAYNMLKSITMTDAPVVTYDATTNGGSCATDEAVFQGTALTLPAATKDGSRFDGWFTTADDEAETGELVGEAGETYIPSADITLYARFTQTTSLATLTDIKVNGTTITGFAADKYEYTIEFPYKTAVVPTITYTRGYEGDGESAGEAVTMSPNPITAVFGDVTLHVVSEDETVEQDYVLHFTEAPKDMLRIIKIATTGGSNKTVTGYFAKAADCAVSLQSDSKFGTSSYMKMALDEEEFQAGDVLNVHITTVAGNGSIALYSTNNSDDALLYNSGVRGVVGDNKITLTDAIEGSSTLYLCRTTNNAWNPYVDYIEVYRPFPKPLLTGIKIDEAVAVVDENDATVYNVIIPAGSNLASLNVVPTFLSNDPSQTNGAVSGSWAIGPNTYVVTDKDGDSKSYTINIARDVAVESVTVSGETTVAAKSQITLTATVLPADVANKAVTWSSSDETKATVDANGVVTGKAAGSVTITATSVADNTKKGTKEITVTKFVGTEYAYWFASTTDATTNDITNDDGTIFENAPTDGSSLSASLTMDVNEVETTYSVTRRSGDSDFGTFHVPADYTANLHMLVIGSGSPRTLTLKETSTSTEYSSAPATFGDAAAHIVFANIPSGNYTFDKHSQSIRVALMVAELNSYPLTSVALEESFNLRLGQSRTPVFTLTPTKAAVISQVWSEVSRTGANDATFNETTGEITAGTEEGTITVKVRVTDAFGNEAESGNCVVNIVDIIEQKDVTGPMTWDWTGAGTANVPINNEEALVLGNYISGDEWAYLKGTMGDQAYHNESSYGSYQGYGTLSFNTTVDGVVRITARRISKDATLKIGENVTVGTLNDTKQTFSPIFVRAGEINIVADATNGMRILKVEFMLPGYEEQEVNTGETNVSTLKDGADVTVHDGATLTIDGDKVLNDLTIEPGGEVVLSSNKLTVVGMFSIETTMASGKSGQLRGATASNFAAQDAYIDITLGAGGTSAQWHAFTVPFPVDALNGVYDQADNKLTNEENYAIMDYHGDIRANGEYGWKKYRGILQPGTFYLMTVDGDRTTYRFRKVAGADIVAENTISYAAYQDGDGVASDKGWNGIGNPTLFYGKINIAVQVLNPNTYTYEVKTANSTNFVVGTPFFYQATAAGSISMSAASGSIFYAPKRQTENEIKEVDITFGNEVFSDHLYISAREEATNNYEIGKDLSKMMMTSTPGVAQIYGKAYGTNLCMIDAPLVNDQATYKFTLYAPTAGEYAITAPNMENVDIYLTKDDAIIWKISEDGYTLDMPQGFTTGYGILLKAKAPAVTTGVENTSENASGVQKVVIDDHVYILRGEKMYDTTGKMVK